MNITELLSEDGLLNTIYIFNTELNKDEISKMREELEILVNCFIYSFQKTGE